MFTCSAPPPRLPGPDLLLDQLHMELGVHAVYSGDFNGDGRDDIALWNEYVDGHDEIHT